MGRTHSLSLHFPSYCLYFTVLSFFRSVQQAHLEKKSQHLSVYTPLFWSTWSTHTGVFTFYLTHFSGVCGRVQIVLDWRLPQPSVSASSLKGDNLHHYKPFSRQTFWLVIVGKAQVWLITLMRAQFYWSVPVSPDSVTVSQHGQHQKPESEASKWNSAIIHFYINLHLSFSRCDVLSLDSLLRSNLSVWLFTLFFNCGQYQIPVVTVLSWPLCATLTRHMRSRAARCHAGVNMEATEVAVCGFTYSVRRAAKARKFMSRRWG